MKFLTRLFVASLAMLAIADVASAQTPGSLTFDGVKLRKNGFTIEIQAPTGLGSDQTFTLPDLTGISNPSFLLSNSSAGQTITGGLTISGGLTLQDINVLLKNTDNTAREFRFFEPSGSGNNYSAFKAQAQGSDLTYSLPASGPSSGDVLKVTAVSGGDVTLSWGSGTPSGPAGGDLTGTYPNPSIAAGAIVDADVSSTAAIAYSKLNLVFSIQNGDIVPNAITTSKVANGTVTTSKLADSAVSGLKLLSHAVTYNHIADGTIIDANISPTAAIAYSKISGTPTSLPPSGAAGGDLTGTYPNPVIAAGAVTSAKIADGTIVNTDISAAAAVAYSKLNLTGSVQGSDIAAGTFTTTNAHHAIGNNDNTARELRFLEPSGSGVNYSAFKAQAQAGDFTYTLPNTAPTAANQVLQTQSVAGNNSTLSWGTISAGAISFNYVSTSASTYNAATTDDFIGVDVSSNAVAVNLPSASSAGAGKMVIVKVIGGDASTNNVTINAAGTDRFNKENSTALTISNNPTGGGTFRLFSDGTSKWYQW